MKTEPEGPTQQQFCKKLAYGRKENPTIILGIIEKEENGFIFFRTSKRQYRISQEAIISLEDTEILFREGG